MEGRGKLYPLPHKTEFFKGQAARKADKRGVFRYHYGRNNVLF